MALLYDFNALIVVVPYFQVIDRRVRELNVYSEILPLSTTAKELKDRNFR